MDRTIKCEHGDSKNDIDSLSDSYLDSDSKSDSDSNSNNGGQ